MEKKASDGAGGDEKKVCTWFQKNRCTRGKNCRFAHVALSTDAKTGTGKRLGKWKRDGLQSRSRKRDWEKYNQGIQRTSTPGVDRVDPTCKCDLTCVRRKVEKKSAKSFGRVYFNCPNWQDRSKNCSFFRWLSDHKSKPREDTSTAKKPKIAEEKNKSGEGKKKALDDSSSSSSSSSSDSSSSDEE